MKERLVIGTRASKLALWQARYVARLLAEAWPHVQVELAEITTTGDVRLDVPLHEVGDKALFTKELERALETGEVDLCVHSLKDVPTTLPAGFCIGAVCERADARDALVCSQDLSGCTSLAQLPRGARVGTSSLRRSAQIKAGYPHLVPADIRGNVDTRLKKADGPDYDAVILAVAGLERMGAQERISSRLGVEEMIPAAGQGAVCVEMRTDDAEVAELVAALDHAPSRRCVQAERRILSQLGGSCKVPVGVHAHEEGSHVLIDACVLSLDAGRQARVHLEADTHGNSLEALCDEALAGLHAQGAQEIMAQILGGQCR